MFSWSPQIKSPVASSLYPGSRKGKNSNNATPTNKFSRDVHLRSYLGDATLKPSTRRVSKDDSTYDTVFQTKGHTALILRVHLPPPTAFSPSQSPAMTLVGVKATHPWVDTRMRVIGYESIKNDAAWATSGLRLGQAVSAVVQHLQLNPPNVIAITDPSLQQLQASISTGQNGTAPAPAPPTASAAPASTKPAAPAKMGRRPPQRLSNSSHTSEPSSDPPPDFDTLLVLEDEDGLEAEVCHMPIPAVPASFPELDSMTTIQMRKLLNSHEEFTSFVDQMSAVKTLNDLRGSVFNGNVESAQRNMQKEKEMTDLHSDVMKLREELKKKVQEFQTLEARQTELCSPPERRDVIKRLTVAKKEAYKESEGIASDFVESGSSMGVSEFVEKFVESRTIHHERAAKVERLNASM